MSEPFNYFEDGLPPEGAPNFPSPFLIPIGYIGNIDEVRLINDFVKAYKLGLDSFYYDLQRYYEPFKFPQDISFSSEKRFIGKFSFVNQIQISANTHSNLIDLKNPFIQVIPDPKSFKATFKLFYTYSDGVVQAEGVESMDVLTESSWEWTAEDLSSKLKAIEFSTHNFWAYEQLMNNFPLDFQRAVINGFDWAFGLIKEDDPVSKRNLIWQAPRFYLRMFPLEMLYEDFIELLEFDRNTFDEANNTIIKLLEVIATIEGGLEFLYKKFNNDPWRLKTLYENLDGSSIRDGEPHANKTILASLMVALCSYQNQGFIKSRKKRYITFQVNDDHRVDSNVASDDKRSTRFDLTQEYETTETFEGYQGHTGTITSWKIGGYTHSLHPLDIITLIIKDNAGKKQTLEVPAIFVKDIAYHAEWETISKRIRLGVDILLIALSAATLFSGASLLFTTLAIVDIGIATADISIQAFEEEIRKLPGGQKFLDTWEEVYFAAGIITGVAALPSLITSGAKLLLKINSAGVRIQLKSMLSYTLERMERFPRFINKKYEIITDFSRLDKRGNQFYNNLVKITENKGVLVLEGVIQGERNSNLFLIHGGMTIFKGNKRQLRKLLKRVFKNGDSGVDTFLRKLEVDPTFRVFGAGVDSHPELWKSTMDELTNAGVKPKYTEKNMTYGPTSGEPGSLSITRDASITALLHEAKHFKDDLAEGFPGLAKWMENGTDRWKLEFDAYMVEVSFLRKEQQFETATEVLINARQEKLDIEELYSIKL